MVRHSKPGKEKTGNERARDLLVVLRHKHNKETKMGVKRGRSLVMVCAVIRAFDMNPTNSSNGLFVVVQMARSSCSAAGGFKQSVVWTPPIVGFIQKNVEGLLIDACFRKLNLNVLQTTLKS